MQPLFVSQFVWSTRCNETSIIGQLSEEIIQTMAEARLNVYLKISPSIVVYCLMGLHFKSLRASMYEPEPRRKTDKYRECVLQILKLCVRFTILSTVIPIALVWVERKWFNHGARSKPNASWRCTAERSLRKCSRADISFNFLTSSAFYYASAWWNPRCGLFLTRFILLRI